MGDDTEKFLLNLKKIMAEHGWKRSDIKDFVEGKMKPPTVDALFDKKRMGEKSKHELARSLPGMGFSSAADIYNYNQGANMEKELWRQIAKIERDINELRQELKNHSHPTSMNRREVINGGKGGI